MKLTLGAAGFFLAIAFVGAVDIPWTILEFIGGMGKAKPVYELNGVSMNKTVGAYHMIIMGFLADTINGHYEEIFNRINETQTAASELSDRLVKETSKDVDFDLKTLNKIALEAIALVPPNKTSEVTPPEPLELPPALGPINVQENPKTTQELIMDFPERMHESIGAFRNLMDQLFMAGWKQARHFYGLDQRWMRKRYSDRMIPYLNTIFTDVEKHTETVKDKVSAETWAEFLRILSELAAAQNS